MGQFDIGQLKVPGYKLLFPKSWTNFLYARVIMYMKSSLHFEQILKLEDDDVQSIWLKGGFKNMPRMLFAMPTGNTLHLWEVAWFVKEMHR